MGVGEGGVPGVVVGCCADYEAAAVDCEEGWEGGDAAAVVGFGEEDAGGLLVVWLRECCVWGVLPDWEFGSDWVGLD